MKPCLDRLILTRRCPLSFLSRRVILPVCLVAVAFPLLVSAANPSVLPAQTQVLSGHVPKLAARLTPIGRLPAEQKLKLALALPLRNQAELTALLQQISDPASPSYRHYLTPQQFAQQFGPSEADYQAVATFAQASGLKVTGKSSNRVILNVEGAAADIEKAFHLTLRVYQHPTEARAFYAPDTEPSVELTVPLLRISGLDNATLPHPKNLRRTIGVKAKDGVSKNGSGPGGTYMGNDFRAAYVPGTPLTGDGQVIGLLEFDGYFPNDISTYENMNGLPNVPLQNVLLDGFSGVPGGGNGEVALDIEVAIAMAPGISQIIVYQGLQAETVCNQMASDNLASQLSCSWGWGGGPNAALDQIFKQMAAQGQTFFNASGDWDAFPPGGVDDPTLPGAPSDDPYIVQVGGTTLTTSGPGGSWVSETVWQVGAASTPYGGEGSAGGISSHYPLPQWQQGIDMSTNGGSTTFRNLPDVALTADNILIVADNGQLEDTGGTSCAAPLWAAFTSLINQQAVENGLPTVGFINPALYSIAKNNFLYGRTFHDVVTGNNTNAVSTNLFYAVTGYDLCTGWGTPAGTNLINLLAPPVGLVPLLRYSTNYLFGGNGNGVIDFDECNGLNVVLTNLGGVIATDVHATLSTTTPGVIIAQPFSPYSTILTNAAVTNLVPFKVSTAPTFACGTPVDFTLVVSTDQTLPVTFRFRLASGIPATPLRYDNGTAGNLAPFGRITSPVTVSAFPSAITKVVVSVFAAVNYDAGLELDLIAPDGTTNILTLNDGGFGQNFGTACGPDSQRTTFDDAASDSIAAGVAPFTGSFQPQQALASFNGKAGTNVNGIWSLRAVDHSGLGGSVQCWSLFLTPATCLDGGGECPGADLGVSMTASPDPLIIGDLVAYTLNVTNIGPSGVHNAAVTQLLPSGIAFVSAAPSQGGWTLAGGIVTFNLGAMPAGSSATMTVIGQAITNGTFVTSATVSSEVTDYNPANNTASVTDHIQVPTTDLAVSLSANPSSVLVGDTLTYTVTAGNNGPSAATSVFVTNTLPAGVSLVAGTVQQGLLTNYPGNVLVWNVGGLTNSASVTATFKVQVLTEGTLVATSTIVGNEYDPVRINNTATATTSSGAAADLAVSIQENLNPVVVYSNLTYNITVTNLGPSVAGGVLLTFNLDPSLTLISSSVSQGGFSVNGSTLIASIGTVPSSGSVQAVVTVSAGLSGPVTSTATVVGGQPDPNQANNTASATVQVASPFFSVVPAGATLTGESFSPPNGTIENGETVTVSLRLRNAGNVANANLQATLLATNGVVPVAPNSIQTYGVLSPSALPVGQPFSFTASGAPGATITAVLQLTDGGVFLTNLGFNFTLPTIFTFTNNAAIAILDDTSALPYPSSITVSGVTGTLARVTATLLNFGHTYPKDVDVLLVAPSGADALLLSHAGNQVSSGANLVFDDRFINNYLPAHGPLLSGTYHPSAYGAAPIFSNPAPSGPFFAALASVNGSNPNGNWSLFVEDDNFSDAGGITNGWSLSLTMISPVNPLADLSLSVVGPPSPVTIPANLTYTYTINNNGPSASTFVVFSNALPAGVSFVSASSSQGAVGLSAGAVLGNLGSLAVGGSATVILTVTPSAALAGGFTSSATVSANEIDLNPINNTASATTLLDLPATDLALSGAIAPSPAVVGYAITNSLVVTNGGSGLALNVSLSSRLPTNALFVTAISTNGTWQTNGGLFTCAFGNLPTNASASVMLVLLPESSGAATNAPIISVVSAATGSIDTNSANNSVTNGVAVNNPSPSLLAAGVKLITESGIVNGAIDIGDTVTVLLAITNAGTADTSPNLTGTLQSSGGIVPVGNPIQVYGVVAHGGGTVGNAYTFNVTGAFPGTGSPKTVSGGGTVVAMLNLQDVQTPASGGAITNNYVVTFPLQLPGTTSQTNISTIIIPSVGTATPYPSVLNISGVTGVVSKATVVFNGVSHTWPSDIDAVLVSPAGQAVALMANTGANDSIVNVSITFDDAAAGPLPQFGRITTGSYQPTTFGTLASLPSAAPAAPYGSSLAAFDGTDPKGNWALYVYDSKDGDSGFIAQGWSLNLTTISPLAPANPGLKIQRAAQGGYELVLNGAPGTTYVLDISSDLTSWTPVWTNTATGLPSVFVVNPQAAVRAFYRVAEQP